MTQISRRKRREWELESDRPFHDIHGAFNRFLACKYWLLLLLARKSCLWAKVRL